jgi:hypothetical protein
MRRNKELLRAILLEVEESPGFDGRERQFFSFEIVGYTKAEVHFHVHMLIRAKYLEAEEQENGFVGYGLTLAGHDYLDTLRDSLAWRMTKSRSGKIVLAVSRIMTQVISALVRQTIQEHINGRSVL